MTRLIALAGVLAAIAVQGAFGQAKLASSLPFNPQDGDTVVFLGDSITHQCLYTQYLEDFFVTRYPQRRIQFVNAGVGGDAAADVLLRFDSDVAVHEPDFVTVLLGMNDGRYQQFEAATFTAYQDGMRKILDRIEALGATPVLLSPTMFDHAVTARRADDEDWRFRAKEFDPDYNALMAFFGGWALEEAGRRQVPFVNLWAPLNTHTIDQRRTDPEFTMIWDAIHPNASGQMVMAFEILFQLGVERNSASGITITRRGDRWVGRGLKDLEASGDTIRFRHTAASLPWVIPAEEAGHKLKWQLPADGRAGYRITKAGHKMSADRLKIAGLDPGDYEVLIDGESIGTWSHIALGTKIEIQENEKTPQYRQALEVALMNQKRNDEFVRPSRDLSSRIKGLRRKAAGRGKNPDAEIAGVQAEVDELKRKAAAMLEDVYAAAQPVEREWVIRRVAAGK